METRLGPRSSGPQISFWPRRLPVTRADGRKEARHATREAAQSRAERSIRPALNTEVSCRSRCLATVSKPDGEHEEDRPGAIVFMGRVDFGDQKLTSSMRPRSACSDRKSNHASSVSAMKGWSAKVNSWPSEYQRRQAAFQTSRCDSGKEGRELRSRRANASALPRQWI
jgi:hypothetical protein